MDTVPSSSGTGEVESLSTKTVITTTPTTTTTTNIPNENNTEFVINNQDGQDNEQIDLASRRGRRSAIIDKKVS